MTVQSKRTTLFPPTFLENEASSKTYKTHKTGKCIFDEWNIERNSGRKMVICSKVWTKKSSHFLYPSKSVEKRWNVIKNVHLYRHINPAFNSGKFAWQKDQWKKLKTAFQIKLKIVQMSHAWEELRAAAKAAETRVRNIVVILLSFLLISLLVYMCIRCVYWISRELIQKSE